MTGSATTPAPPPPPPAPPPKFVTDDITLLFNQLTPPEDQVVFNAAPQPQRPTLGDINGSADGSVPGSVESFELRTGPSDLDAYHDFYTLQMAFEDVWLELTGDAGVYRAWNALMDATLGAQRGADTSKQFTFVDDQGRVTRSDGSVVSGPGGNPLVITEINDVQTLQAFLSFIAVEFGLLTSVAPADAGLANVVQSLATVSADLFNQVNRLGHNNDDWGTGTSSEVNVRGSKKDSNWPDDEVCSDGANKPTGPFTTPPDGVGVSRYEYLRNTMEQVQQLLEGAMPAIDNAPSAVTDMLFGLDAILKERYTFDVFAPNSINYGLVLNYRQHWTPIAYQVGDLVSTVPLAPLEVRKYTTRHTVAQSRSLKQTRDASRAAQDEYSQTSRVDSQIVDQAQNKSNFQQNASGSFGNSEIFKASTSLQQGTDQSVQSNQTKQDFHEATSKSAQSYRQEHRSEIDTSESQEDQATGYRELRNPNEELTVTYLFYELQRRYQVTEALNKVTPVIMVANDVPSPHEIDEAWLVRYDWILKRVILDDSYLDALDYLSAGYTGVEVQLEILKDEVEHQRGVVDKISQQVSKANDALNAATIGLQDAEDKTIADDEEAATLAAVKKVFDPLGISGSSSDGNADRARLDFAKDALNRAQDKVTQLLAQLKTETTALQQAIDKYVAAAEPHFNKMTQIARLRAHVKDNILYYMQGIWTYENPDERYFRLYDIDVPTFTHHTTVQAGPDPAPDALLNRSLDPAKNWWTVPQFPLAVLAQNMKLHQVADIDNLLGFKGNYMIFPVVDFNYMNWLMMKDYLTFTIDPNAPNGGTVQARDPDPLANLTLTDLQAALEQIRAQDPQSFNANADKFQEIMRRLLEDENDEIIVPSHSLYIEALPGTHPLLEDFKLIRRAVELKRAQADLRSAELQNLQTASSLDQNVLSNSDDDNVVMVGSAQKVVVGDGQA